MRERPGVWLALALGVACLGSPGAAQDGGQTVETLERRAEQDRERAADLRQKAQNLANELQSLRKRSVELTERTRTLADRISQVESRLADLKNTRRTLENKLARRRKQLATTLAGVQRIALQPPATLAVRDESPLEIARAASLLDTAVPELNQRAAALRRNLDQLRTLRSRIAQEKSRLQNNKVKLAARREELAALVARKKRLVKRTREASREARENARRLAREAADMRELVTMLEERAAARPEAAPAPGRKPEDVADGDGTGTGGDGAGEQPSAGEQLPDTESQEAVATQTAALTQPADVRPFPSDKNSLRMPVAGRFAAAFGDTIQRRGTERTAEGVVIAARDGTSVVAPFDGKVVYAGPFKSYGRILILKHGETYHSLLAGLDRVNAIVGQWVLAGEPVGAIEARGGDGPRLYVELRRDGTPIDPAPWLARRGERVRG